MAPATRLRFHLEAEGAIWYHRAGPVNHVMIDPSARARALASGFVRPIELWRAPRWEQPPSVAVVRYAENEPAGARADEPPGLGKVVNRATVVDFVSDVSAFRLGALGALIDAVAAALTGGPPVVLAGGPDDDERAMWIGAVSFFAPPAVGLQLSFSTHERLDDVLKQLERSARLERGAPPSGWTTPVLSVVPYADVDRLSKRDELPVVVVDPRVEATLGAVGGVEHRLTQLGQRIAVTDWSRLALDACCEDFTVLELCLERLDQVSVGGAAPEGRAQWWPAADDAAARSPQSAGPAWTLAAAVALTGGMRLALPTATRVLLRDTPSSVQLPTELAANLTSLVVATVDDAEQAWARLEAARSASPMRTALVQAAFESYLRLAGDDEAWLLRAPVPLPALPVTDPGLAARLHAPLAALTGRLAGRAETDVRTGVLLLRAVDFAHRAVALAGGPDPGSFGMPGLADRAGAALLDVDTGERVAEVAGALDAGALARWVAPALDRAFPQEWPGEASAVGERLPASVTALLARGVDVARVAKLTPDALAREPVALEVAVASATGRIAGDPRLRRPALEYLLHRAAATYPDADPAGLVEEVFGRLDADEPWPAAELLLVVGRAPAVLASHLVPVALRHLGDWVDDADSGRLAAALLKRIEFLPRLGGDGRPRPRRAGTTDEEAQLLNLLAATGEGWLGLDDGLHRRAAEILMWADRAWPAASPSVRELIAPRITVAAFQVALAAEPAQAGTVLRSRLGVVPVGSAWQAAIPVGLVPALPMIHTVLGLNRYRMAGELVGASTRAMLAPDGLLTDLPPDVPRLPRLPVGPVVRSLVTGEPTGRLGEHLAILVDQEMHAHEGPIDATRLIGFWEAALPGATLDPGRAALTRREPRPGSALAVAFGVSAASAAESNRAGLAQLLALEPADRPAAGWEANGHPGAHRPAPGRLRKTIDRLRRWAGR